MRPAVVIIGLGCVSRAYGFDAETQSRGVVLVR
jgi:hypothetical protein